MPMPEPPAELLARLQFAFTISWHIVFPALSIGLASYLAVLDVLWLRTRDRVYLALFEYWKRIFALSFGMGVVSGVVMSYQFGTNWAVFSDRAGPVIGPLMAYEVLTAFFLEAGFLGVMLFGRERVGERLHLFATVMVAVGTLASAFWILSVNSWMQTPQGHAVDGLGRFVPVDWWAIVFNPSFPYRLVHMVFAAYLAVAFVVGGVAARHLLRDGADAAARRAFSMAMWMAALVAPAQILAGDLHGLNTLEHQPAKVAAMEGHFRREGDNQPLVLVGLPDAQAGQVRYAVEIPYLGSLILTHSLHGQIAGLLEFPADQRPPVTIPFWSFRLMVAIGFAMAGIGIWSLWLRWRRRLFASRWLLRAAMVMGPSGIVAILAGWITTEVGRQPWTVYGLLRTSDSLSPVDAPAVAASLTGFFVVYVFVFGAGIFYLLRLMATPVPAEPGAGGAPVAGPAPLLAPHFAPDLLPGDDEEPAAQGRDGGGPR